ncbi:Cuticle-degrading protease [Grifola frondosa]|uniref:Cuticle-degrading protease n=1 Tax=Grifola frondosa TaxID=5627 RepID=A0A1C7MQN5_GRIFR|nr:Cuticle-degrading protease [Grifola frondosa]
MRMALWHREEHKKVAFVMWSICSIVQSCQGFAIKWSCCCSVSERLCRTLSPDALKILRSSPDVDYIAEDGVFSINAAVTQTNAPWGLARISQNAELADQNTNDLTFTYTYDSSAGSGVDIYVVDTGIFTGHSEFGGRAIWGATFGGYADADGNGHGTHVSGTAAGSTYGVAKSAHLIAVKVLSDSGSGFVSDIVSGLSWVATQVQASGRPSIATMSLGGGASTPLDNAVASLTSAGIHVTVAAGNSDTDAGSTSPARAPSANTIGATTIADARASFSNYGSVVDLWAPGQNVISAWIGSTTATNNISGGTSMATPHVAGLIATIISRDGNASPASISATLQSLSIKNTISGIPSGTINDLARNEEWMAHLFYSEISWIRGNESFGTTRSVSFTMQRQNSKSFA